MFFITYSSLYFLLLNTMIVKTIKKYNIEDISTKQWHI